MEAAERERRSHCRGRGSKGREPEDLSLRDARGSGWASPARGPGGNGDICMTPLTPGTPIFPSLVRCSLWLYDPPFAEKPSDSEKEIQPVSEQFTFATFPQLGRVCSKMYIFNTGSPRGHRLHPRGIKEALIQKNKVQNWKPARLGFTPVSFQLCDPAQSIQPLRASVSFTYAMSSIYLLCLSHKVTEQVPSMGELT